MTVLFFQACISSQARDGNLEQFYTHENQAAPPSLSLEQVGILHCLKKRQHGQ